MAEQSTPTGAVFLSYASQDAEAAARICESLRAAGIEVWFDRSDLRGGDAWDAHIKKQIHELRIVSFRLFPRKPMREPKATSVASGNLQRGD